MKRFVLAVLALGALTALVPTSASAWSEANCRQKCWLTSATKAGTDACIIAVNCARFRGGRNESNAKVFQSAKTYNHDRGYYGPMGEAYQRQFRQK